jgi:hypothetical protein
MERQTTLASSALLIEIEAALLNCVVMDLDCRDFHGNRCSVPTSSHLL